LLETVDKQSDQQCVRAALEDALDKSVGVHAPIHNQAVNGVLASNLKYATIDMHAASDSLSWWLMHEVLPRRVYEDCMYARSAYLQLPTGERIVNPLFCTMGNGFCFALETAVFLACIRAAVKSWCDFQLIPFDDDYCWAYGDDLLVIADAYEYVVEWLERLDFVINRDKSFTYPSAFRESCGLDWYNGDLVSSVYWPRAVIEPNIDSCASLCALETRLFQRGGGTKYFEAYNFLINQVHRIDKRISIVPINWLLEYQLEGTVLVSLTAPEPECQHYKRAYGLVKGDNLVYEEDRFYVNQIHAKQEMGSVKGGQVIDSYLYYTFLKQGPRYDSDLSSYLGISSSYYDDSLRCKSGGFVVARKRLI
jgi:signal peptidase I